MPDLSSIGRHPGRSDVRRRDSVEKDPVMSHESTARPSRGRASIRSAASITSRAEITSMQARPKSHRESSQQGEKYVLWDWTSAKDYTVTTVSRAIVSRRSGSRLKLNELINI